LKELNGSISGPTYSSGRLQNKPRSRRVEAAVGKLKNHTDPEEDLTYHLNGINWKVGVLENEIKLARGLGSNLEKGPSPICSQSSEKVCSHCIIPSI
jgi:hypothetical protein